MIESGKTKPDAMTMASIFLAMKKAATEDINFVRNMFDSLTSKNCFLGIP
jgi:hypothetical protein